MGSCPLPWHSDSLVSLFSYTEVSGDGVGGEVCGEQERGLGGASGGQDRASCPMALALCRTPKDRQIPGGYGGLQGPSLISAWARGLREVLRPGSVGVRANLDVQVGGFPVGGGVASQCHLPLLGVVPGAALGRGLGDPQLPVRG